MFGGRFGSEEIPSVINTQPDLPPSPEARYLTKYFKWNGGRNENILMEPENTYTFMKKHKAGR